MARIEYGYTSLNKKGEELCGDKVEYCHSSKSNVWVLADGMGSGVKANILATLTSKILSTMIANDIPLFDCLETIIQSLPVCKVRGVAYSTFSIISLNKDGVGTIVEFDNPQAIYLHAGKEQPLERNESIVNGKKIFISPLSFDTNDCLIVMSDGVLHAGIGENLNFGWDRKDILDFIVGNYSDNLTPPCLASLIANACFKLYNSLPGDDTTVLTIQSRPTLKATIMIGPPSEKNLDDIVAEKLTTAEGKKIVCGGSSSNLIARYLGTTVSTSFNFVDKDIPPIGYIDGIDLTTEGALTLKKLMEYAEFYSSHSSSAVKQFDGLDGASLLAKAIFIDSTDITLLIGRSVNMAHEGLAIANRLKLDIVDRIITILRDLGKEVTVNYY